MVVLLRPVAGDQLYFVAPLARNVNEPPGHILVSGLTWKFAGLIVITCFTESIRKQVSGL